jgi:hypothetical protein
MNDSLNWKRDLEGLVDEKSLNDLSGLIDECKRQRATAIGRLLFWLPFLLIILVLVVWLFTEWKNSIRADVANGIIAFGLALSALLVRSLPTISKDEVDRILNSNILNATFSKIKAEVGGGGERLHQWIALFSAAALLGVVLLKSFVPDPGNSKNDKEVNHATRQMPPHGRTLPP